VRRPAGIAVVAALMLAVPAAATAACPQTTLGDVEDEVMCLVCGTPLAVATEAPQAQRERDLIQRLIARCKSKDEIKQALAAQFGDRVLATPDDSGFDLAAYLIPALILLFGAVAVAFSVRRWRRTRGPGRPAPASNAASARLDADIERYDL
jgi:cytochrome c-type biogenesis protein CcmH/NrfF